MRVIIDKLDFIKKEYFVKDKFKRMRRQAIDWEKVFRTGKSGQGLLSKIYEELLKLTNKIISQLRDGQKIQTDMK